MEFFNSHRRLHSKPTEPRSMSSITVSYTHLDVYKRQVITLARRSEAAKTEQILKASPEHILGEDKSTLLHETGQLVGLGQGKSVRINTGIENDEAMAEGLWEIASDKKRNAHLFQLSLIHISTVR